MHPQRPKLASYVNTELRVVAGVAEIASVSKVISIITILIIWNSKTLVDAVITEPEHNK